MRRDRFLRYKDFESKKDKVQKRNIILMIYLYVISCSLALDLQYIIIREKKCSIQIQFYGMPVRELLVSFDF